MSIHLGQRASPFAFSASQPEYRGAEEGEEEAPSEINILIERVPGVDGGVGYEAVTDEDQAEKQKEQPHGQADVELLHDGMGMGLPEEEVQSCGQDEHDDAEGDGTRIAGGRVVVANLLRERIDEPPQLFVGPVGRGGEGDDDGTGEAASEGEDRHPEALGHGADKAVLHGEPTALEEGGGLTEGQRVGLEKHRRKRAEQQTEEGAVPGGPPPEHAEQEDGEERCVDETEHQLEHVHDVVEFSRRIGADCADEQADDGGETADLEEMRVSGIGLEPALIEVVGPKFQLQALGLRVTQKVLRHERTVRLPKNSGEQLVLLLCLNEGGEY